MKCRILLTKPNKEIKARPTPWNRVPTDMLVGICGWLTVVGGGFLLIY